MEVPEDEESFDEEGAIKKQGHWYGEDGTGMKWFPFFCFFMNSLVMWSESFLEMERVLKQLKKKQCPLRRDKFSILTLEGFGASSKMFQRSWLEAPRSIFPLKVDVSLSCFQALESLEIHLKRWYLGRNSSNSFLVAWLQTPFSVP